MILPSINTAVCRKKMQWYFRKLSQQFCCNKDSLLVLVSLSFLFFLDYFFPWGLGPRTLAQKHLRHVTSGICSSGEHVTSRQKVSLEVALQRRVSRCSVLARISQGHADFCTNMETVRSVWTVSNFCLCRERPFWFCSFHVHLSNTSLCGQPLC